ncbi:MULTISPECIES: aminotransferase class I/II-fold pyridoxal phosphate-dependent enzyme [unclassified Lactobacillus]|uniref:aminotransferase class I/II-fold pyridoxal phosphate-dependent enzyme n=1 Tax=unclassified Lactobacillus TaxID=2620435 RepID=UPI00226ACEB6|nr:MULTISPECIES: aminotransferase class I/II-fold pyridoxal phosphate-dependent enzyme [unclassified Lactobacillus]MCX8722020.1 aminotransferase class I/II-fold pyridoxal phosphate-dependent enzyme [Lactobacillus sp. B4010]MCX8732658.1 aminotransferase class I/II-fold pyridoxal phosphate-dependent enzyme [Lactobacillus sp. B4015]MCX8734878.1 aminotransferase class I/II-fold pyridoxal phosphate-dependent enzyme [Lactobacillus sp. B4012]
MPHLAADLTAITATPLAEIPPSGIRAFAQKVDDIPGLIKLTLGEPDLNTPEHVKQAAVQSILDNDSHYSAQKGTPKLRRAISAYLKRKQNLSYDPETEVIVTVGATEAIACAMLALFQPGDEIIVPTPSYALYFPLIQFTKAKLVPINTAKTNFVLTPEALKDTLRQHPHAKAILLNYPTNPTGRECSSSVLAQLAPIIAENHLYVISDEIYGELTYGIKHTSIARYLPDRTLLINGLSKSHAMTGYRIGYIAGPANLISPIAKMHAFLVTAPSNPAQAAAAEALEHGDDDPAQARPIYQKRRDYLVKALNDLGLKTMTSEGAFYVFTQIPAEYGTDDEKFALDLARQAKVGVTPGSAFGPGGEGHVRFSYAASDADLHEAVNRIKNFLVTKDDNK